MKVKVFIAQSCPTLCNSMGCSLQNPLSMEFFRQEYSSSHSLLQRIFLTQIEPRSPALQADSFLSEPPGKPKPFPKYF